MAMARRIPHRQRFGTAGLVCVAAVSLGAALLQVPPLAMATGRPASLSASSMAAPAATRADPQLLEAAQEAERQAGALYNARQYGEALKMQLHAVKLHRQLVAEDPSQRLLLAASLHNLGVVLIRQGKKAEAIPPTEESLALYRSASSLEDGSVPLAIERPLRNLVLLYFESNRAQEALPLADDLLRIHKSMAAVDPLREGERVDVLNLRASLLVTLNRPKEALKDLQTAVALGRDLAQLDAQDVGLKYGLAGSLMNFSQVADLLREHAQALPPAQDAEALLRQVARQQPQLKGDWAKSLSRLGQAYAKVGDPTRARLALEESVALLRSLDRSPLGSLAVEVGGYRDDLAHALETLAEVLAQLQRPEEARLAVQEAMEIYGALAQVDHRYSRDLERTRSRLSPQPQTTPLPR